MYWIVIFLSLFISGLGPSYWLCNLLKENTKPYSFLLPLSLAPILSYSIFTIINVYLINFDLFFDWSLKVYWLIASLSLISLLGYLIYVNRKLSLSHVKSTPYLFILISSIIAYLFHNFENGLLRHILSPDLVAYASTADWLSQSSIADIVIHNDGVALNFAVFSELIFKSHRWGFVSLTSMISRLFGISSYECMFPLTYIVFVCSALFGSLMFQYYKISTRSIYQISASFIILNSTILYLLFEAFYPSIIAISYLFIIASVIFSDLNNNNKMFNFIIASTAIATLLATYSEASMIAFGLIGMFYCIKSLQLKKIYIPSIVFLSVLFSLLSIFPLTIKIIHFTIANINNSANVGYILPEWFWLSDLLGLTTEFYSLNAYLDNAVATHVIDRSTIMWCLVSIFTLWGGSEIFKFKKNILLLSIIILGSIFLFYNLYLITKNYPPHNYLYDKLIILFSPCLIVFFISALTYSRFFYIKVIIVGIFVSISVCLTYFQVKKFSNIIDLDGLLEIKNHFNGEDVFFLPEARGTRNAVLHAKYRYIDYSRDFIFNSILKSNYIDQWHAENICNVPKESKIIYIKNKNIYPFQDTKFPEPYKRLYSTKMYEVLDTKITIKYVCTKQPSEVYKELNSIYNTQHQYELLSNLALPVVGP